MFSNFKKEIEKLYEDGIEIDRFDSLIGSPDKISITVNLVKGMKKVEKRYKKTASYDKILDEHYLEIEKGVILWEEGRNYRAE